MTPPLQTPPDTPRYPANPPTAAACCVQIFPPDWTGWSRRKMTGCPLVGTSIAPDGVASLASSRVSVRSTGAAPESRRPTRFDCAVTVHVCVRNADRPAAVNQSSRGPNRTYKSVGLPGFGRSVGHGCGRPTPASHAVDAVRMASRCLAAIGRGPMPLIVSVAAIDANHQ